MIETPDRKPDAELNNNRFWFEPEMVAFTYASKRTMKLILLEGEIYIDDTKPGSKVYLEYQALYQNWVDKMILEYE